jgi:sodium-dependent dicarboxylate transporter 2/3/5
MSSSRPRRPRSAIDRLTIGILGALILFVIPARDRDGSTRSLLSWDEARIIPWDVLLLFGGGLSLAAAMESTGLARWLGDQMTGLGSLPPIPLFLDSPSACWC